MDTKDAYKDLIVGSSIVVILAVTFIVGMQFLTNKSFDISEYSGMSDIMSPRNADKIKSFASVEDFKQYLEEAPKDEMAYQKRMAMPEASFEMGVESSMDADALKSTNTSAAVAGGVERVSTTNVQVMGIDEPDIVKTDGENIFVADPFFKNSIRPFGMEREMIDVSDTESPAIMADRMAPELIMPPIVQGGVHAVKAFPPADMNIEGTITEEGELLLSGDTLLIMGAQKIFGYDVSNEAQPQKKWTLDVEQNNRVVTSRLYNGELYLVTSQYIDRGTPCPIMPMKVRDELMTISCDNIYHPATPIPVDTTYTAMKIDIEVGEVVEHTSFVGSINSSNVYMSKNALYISYEHPVSMIDMMLPFIEKNKDIFPSDVVEKAKKLARYDISENSKLQELQVLLETSYDNLSNDERLKFQNEVENRMKIYMSEKRRDLEKTGIAKIDIDDLKIERTGIVPGRLLNQFSMDEYEGNLRVATTLGGVWNQFGGRQESANDVHVLDEKMNIVGSVQDMGIDERIYAVRFLGDKGYVVTFRQIDPFIVLDLSNPKNPQKKGELKIPGYSSYLHPLTEDWILGIGKEDSNVKISLFDVSDPNNPIERSKYMLDEYWSDILNTHHAFLADEKHEIFFLPGSKGGYIFSYEDGTIEMVKAVSTVQARRAIYINDYLYIIGNDSIVVLNESDWERVNELELR